MGRVSSYRINLANGVGQVWLCSWDRLATEVGELWDLIAEHLVDCLLLKKLDTSSGTSAIIQQYGEDLYANYFSVIVYRRCVAMMIDLLQ